MIDHLAHGIVRAQMVQTRVRTDVIDTGLVVVAVRGNEALGPAAWWASVVAG